jgi:anaerobic magnesium-protoporphyrin IX monomethyl ester cyclase
LIIAGVKARLPNVRVVYGGVFPTYHWRDVLMETPHVDVIVRGEGEETCRQVMRALASGTSLEEVRGVAFLRKGQVHATGDANMIVDLDAYRVGWELIDHRDYSYWGGKRAVVIQFSRGCPHLCTYCGQRGFWTRWRHRSPEKLAKEIARLHREHGVRVFNFADENPTSSRPAWLAFLHALIAENVHVEIVGSTRAGDIVRDADILHLYRKAGVVRFLMGTESTDEATLEKVKKGSTTAIDREAIRLLRLHGIQSLATWVVGFEEERLSDYVRGLRQLLLYDPDQIQLLFVTPHRWTAYFGEAVNRRVIQTDRRLWDYKHQVLATRHLPPWAVMLAAKTMESTLQLRPRALWRVLTGFDEEFRHSMRWYYRMGRRVWFYEWTRWLFHEERTSNGPTVGEMWGAPQAHEEMPLEIVRASSPPITITRRAS